MYANFKLRGTADRFIFAQIEEISFFKKPQIFIIYRRRRMDVFAQSAYNWHDIETGKKLPDQKTLRELEEAEYAKREFAKQSND